MPKAAYKLLLLFLRCLVYGKRAFVWLGHRLLLALGIVGAWYRQTIGFRVYKFFFLSQKKLGDWKEPWPMHAVEFFGQRAVLQILLLGLGLLLMLPHSKLQARDDIHIPGQRTILYALIGPGDEAFEIEELVVNLQDDGNRATETRSWREGAATAEPGVVHPIAFIPEEQVIGTSLGGSVLTKPTIFPGSALPGSTGPARSEMVFYEVKPGDVIGAIAERYGVSVATILWANNLSARSYIRPGDMLKILPVSGVVHQVKKGDTISKIARAYGAKEEDIVSFNKLQPGGSDIVAGEELIVPGGAKQPVQTAAPVRRSTLVGSVAAPVASVEAPAGSGYLWPAGVRRITQYFGVRHTGMDIAGPVGTSLYATKAGTVVRSTCGWNGGYGCYIIVDHGGGVQSLYGHASQLFVSVGDSVSQGQVIAAMGSTGRSTGPHLHFEIRVSGRKQNPLRYVR